MGKKGVNPQGAIYEYGLDLFEGSYHDEYPSQYTIFSYIFFLTFE